MTKRWLGLKDADVVIDAAAGTFTADVLIDGCAVNGPGGTGFTGRWRVARGLILAVVAEAVCYEGESSRRGPRG
jgi:4'-phosphopantetheinyl transferase EntD